MKKIDLDVIERIAEDFAKDFGRFLLKNAHVSVMGNRVLLRLNDKEIEGIVNEQFETFQNDNSGKDS